MRDVVGNRLQTMEALDEQYATIYRDHPMVDAPDFVKSLRELIHGAEASSIIDNKI